MRLLSFRITNFRSIIDTGWVHFSTDNVTALVGQNESGKTAILEALSKTFSDENVELDDLRHDDPLPEVSITTHWSEEEIVAATEAMTSESCRNLVIDEIRKNKFLVKWRFSTIHSKSDSTGPTISYAIDEPNLETAILKHLETVDLMRKTGVLLSEISKISSPSTTPVEGEVNSPNQDAEITPGASATEFVDSLFKTAPSFVLFEENSGLLPNQIDISDDFKLQRSIGVAAARNFLTIAGIDLKTLVTSDTRARAATLKKANRQITENFLAFWSQTLGKQTRLQLECSIHHHPIGHEKAGRSYLEFLITDQAAALYPKQRSRGTRWFISFFLQLRASEVRKGNVIFLLDEPGANLHEKAQADVLTLIEKIKTRMGVIYSTHSPYLISDKSIHRILAVERDADNESHPTKVIGSHALGAASTDTLSPIFTMMGASFSRQTTIKKHHNVILEELSSYYYLKAFWSLTNCRQEVHFLPANGTSNVTTFAQLFLGWGLDFIVIVDDEPSGRAVYKTLKRDMFLDDEIWASKRMLKIKDCEGIEDIFEAIDYKTYVLSDPEIAVNLSNAKWAKVNGAAKAVHALKFLQSIERNEVSMDRFHLSSQQRISSLVAAIAARLENY
jgi:ABC-type cobalamin/Fe3+-siderophores transport system ATPase subunit